MQDSDKAGQSGGTTPSAADNPGSVMNVKQTSNEDEAILCIIRRYVLPFWKRYLIVAFLFAFLFALLSYKVMPMYSATVVAQAQTSSTQDLLKSKLSGLAGTLSGLSMRGGVTDLLYNLSYIESQELADAFIKKYNLRKELFYKAYDEDGNYLKESQTEKNYVRLFGEDYLSKNDDDIYKTPGPTKQQVLKAFNRVFGIAVDKKNMAVSVSVRWKDPIYAKRWANDYIKLVNDVLRNKAIEESTLKINYLEAQLDKTSEIEIQQSIYSLIEEELKQIAVAEASEEYAFKIVQRAYLPERRISPNRWRFLYFGGFLGLLLVFVQVAGPDMFRKLKSMIVGA